jgi:hypothetical protein
VGCCVYVDLSNDSGIFWSLTTKAAACANYSADSGHLRIPVGLIAHAGLHCSDSPLLSGCQCRKAPGNHQQTGQSQSESKLGSQAPARHQENMVVVVLAAGSEKSYRRIPILLTDDHRITAHSAFAPEDTCRDHRRSALKGAAPLSKVQLPGH